MSFNDLIEMMNPQTPTEAALAFERVLSYLGTSEHQPLELLGPILSELEGETWVLLDTSAGSLEPSKELQRVLASYERFLSTLRGIRLSLGPDADPVQAALLQLSYLVSLLVLHFKATLKGWTP